MIPSRVRWSALVIIAVTLAFVYAYSAIRELNFSETMAFAQLVFTILAFGFVLYTLYAALAQLRKSMAKPKLEVIFSETGNAETSIDLLQNKEGKHYLKLSVINKGNAITKLFQIDFKVPTIFDPRLEATVGLIPSLAFAGKASNPQPNADKTSTISYYSNEQVYCFVNTPAPIYMLTIDIRPSEYNNYPLEFKIHYMVYGD